MNEWHKYMEAIKSIKNPNDVNIIKLSKGDIYYGFCIMINNGNNVKFSLPAKEFDGFASPINFITEDLDENYWKDFVIISGNIAINKNHLTQLEYIDESLIDNRAKRVELYARFDDGNYIFLSNPVKSHFMKDWKNKIEQMCGKKFVDTTQELIEKYGINK